MHVPQFMYQNPHCIKLGRQWVILVMPNGTKTLNVWVFKTVIVLTAIYIVESNKMTGLLFGHANSQAHIIGIIVFNSTAVLHSIFHCSMCSCSSDEVGLV